MVPDALLEETARRFALLGDPTRLRILRALESGEASTSEIAHATGLAAPNVSQHLARLGTSGLVARRRTGANVYYRITDASLTELCNLVCAGVRARAESLVAS